MVTTLDFRPGTVNVPAIQGSDLSFSITITQSNAVTPVNITGYDFEMDVVTSTGTVLQALVIGAGITVTSAVNGALSLAIEGNNLIFSNSRCDITVYGLLWVTDTNNIRRPYVQFIFVLAPQIPTS